jgi:hypothetical protein
MFGDKGGVGDRAAKAWSVSLWGPASFYWLRYRSQVVGTGVAPTDSSWHSADVSARNPPLHILDSPAPRLRINWTLTQDEPLLVHWMES